MIQLDRRLVLTSGMFGLAGLMLPAGRAAAQAILGLTGFTHDVASGEPAADSVLLWTRYVPSTGGEARVRVELAETPDFVRVAGAAEMTTGRWRDHTIKLTVDGLKPATRYHYRFIGPDGAISPIGRTKTLPAGRTNAFRLATFSCSNLGYGEFNAYGHAAARDDIDAVLHLGDYFYEYGRGGYDGGAKFAERILPAGEIYSLADYRLRYAAYRLDPQLQALHRNQPWIISADDHEIANDDWEGGAQNHQPDEGDWQMRRLAAREAWREWLPVGELPYKRYDLGELATFWRTDTRSLGRSEQHDYYDLAKGDPAAVQKALSEFRDGPWRDPAATMFGTEQEDWLHHGLARDKAAWQLVGVGTNVGYTGVPAGIADLLPPDAPERSRAYLQRGIAATRAGLPYNLDNWGGYPAAKARFLGAAQGAGRDLVVLTGDSHNAWGFDLETGGRAAGVEFGGTSVTSPGMEQSFKGVDPQAVARVLIEGNRDELRYVDTANRGYLHTTVTPAAVTTQYVYLDTIRAVSLATRAPTTLRVRKGRRTLETV